MRFHVSLLFDIMAQGREFLNRFTKLSWINPKTHNHPQSIHVRLNIFALQKRFNNYIETHWTMKLAKVLIQKVFFFEGLKRYKKEFNYTKIVLRMSIRRNREINKINTIRFQISILFTLIFPFHTYFTIYILFFFLFMRIK